MTQFRHVAAAAACSSIFAACAPDYATFVTSTDIGISADATTENVNIGYTRTESFLGPGYPTEGGAPSAVGYISSNLSAFSPQVKQLYATGDAADLVTQHDAPATAPETGDALEGARRPLLFGTGTKFGFDFGFTGSAPSSLRFGFTREEASVIPLQKADPTTGQPDKYASVLAAFNMGTTAGSQSGTSVTPTQFFATGAAARNLAKRADIRDMFGAQANEAVKAATANLSGTYNYDDSSQQLLAFWMPDGKTISPANQKTIQTCMSKLNVQGNIWFLVYGGKPEDRGAVLTCARAS